VALLLGLEESVLHHGYSNEFSGSAAEPGRKRPASQLAWSTVALLLGLEESVLHHSYSMECSGSASQL
jgi:hypothetical protein